MSVTVLRFSRDSQRMSRRISGEFVRKCSHGAVSGVASWMDDDRQLGEAGSGHLRCVQAKESRLSRKVCHVVRNCCRRADVIFPVKDDGYAG